MISSRGVDVNVVDLSYEIPSSTSLSCIPFRTAKPAIPILHSVSVHIPAGGFVGILGPSGSGKTTLLNLLAARSEHPPSSGHILFSGRSRSARTKRRIGYIMQDDVFLSKLTVRETLQFTADVRLSRRFTKAQRTARIDHLLTQLRLTDCQHVRVGDQQFDKGISGGERKRLNVANELLHDPALLLADECTSGLDAASAQTVIQLLRDRCAHHGRTVIATIHQPSSLIFSLFSNVLLLAEGCVVYYGPPANIVDYFQSLHFSIPTHHINPADHVLHLVTRQPRSLGQPKLRHTNQQTSLSAQQSTDDQSQTHSDPVDRLKEAWRTQLPSNGTLEQFQPHIRASNSGITLTSTPVAIQANSISLHMDSGSEIDDHDDDCDEFHGHENQDGTNGPQQADIQQYSGFDANDIEAVIPETDLASPTTTLGRMRRAVTKRALDISGRHEIVQANGGDKYATDWFTQMLALTRRAVRQKRGLLIETASVLSMIAVTVITSLFWFRIEPLENTVEDRLGILSFTSVYWAFQSTFSSIFAFPREKRVLNKDRASGAYRLSAYIFAKAFVSRKQASFDCALMLLH